MKEQTVLLRLFVISIIWGGNYVASAYLLRDFSPIFLSFARLLSTSIFLIAVAMIGGKMHRLTRTEWKLIIFAGFFGTLGHYFFYFLGLQTSTAGNAALIIAVTPVATTILARIFLRESITVMKLSGALIALIGVVCIVAFGGKTLAVSYGDVYLFISMVMMAVGILFIRRLTDSMPSYDVTILTTIAGTLLMAPTLLIEAAQGNMLFSTSATMWLLLAAAGIIGQGLTAFWWNQAISVVGASVSSMFMYIPPFVAIVVAHFLLGDPIRGSQMIGGVLILLGVAISSSKITLSKKGIHTANP